MTSAPIHASISVHDGPASNCVRSTTRTPVSALSMPVLLCLMPPACWLLSCERTIASESVIAGMDAGLKYWAESYHPGRGAILDVHFINTRPVGAAPWWVASCPRRWESSRRAPWGLDARLRGHDMLLVMTLVPDLRNGH